MLNYFSTCHFKITRDSEEYNIIYIILHPSPSFIKYVLQYGYLDAYVNSNLCNNQLMGILIENIWLSYSFLSGISSCFGLSLFLSWM